MKFKSRTSNVVSIITDCNKFPGIRLGPQGLPSRARNASDICGAAKVLSDVTELLNNKGTSLDMFYLQAKTDLSHFQIFFDLFLGFSNFFSSFLQ